MTPNCIAAVSAAAGRQITQAEAKGLEERIRANMRLLARGDREKWNALAVDQRLQAASDLAAKQIAAEAAVKQRRLVLGAQKQAALDGYIGDAGKRGLDPLDALKRTLVFEADGKSNFTPVESRIKAVRTDYLRQLWQAFEATEPRIFGLIANRDGVRAFTKELFGEKSNSEIARKGAEQFHAIAETMRQRFNAGGGIIPKREDWNIPQHHDQTRVAAAGLEKWTRDTLPLLDREQYVNDDGTLMNDNQVGAFLKEAYRTIATGGMNKIEPGSNAGRGSGMMANRGNEARQIHYKNADSYLAYQGEYGARTIEQVIASHVTQLARDISMVETYGPNPDHVFRFFSERGAQQITEATPTRTGKVKGQLRRLDNLFNYLVGRRDPIASQWLARGADSLRQWLIATRLGSSTITALVDESTLHLTARVNALPTARLVANELATLNMADRTEKRTAARAGLGIESLTSELSRWGEDNLGRSFASKVAETTMRLSRLDALDSARRRALGATIYDVLGAMTRDHATIGELTREDIGILKQKGVTEQDWQVWRKAETSDWGNGNSHVLEPDAIMRIPDAALADMTGGDAAKARQLREEAVTKLLAHVLEEGDMAVPAPGAAERIISGAGLQRGTLSGELWRSLMLFKSFPLAMIRKHWQRASGMPTAGGQALYLTQLVAGTTILGAVSMEINDILAGKDPQRMWNAPGPELTKNWVAAFLKGGSMGLYGDFLFSSVSKSGKNDLFGTLAGPVGGLVQEAMNVTQGNLVKDVEGLQQQSFGGELVRFGKGLTPGATLWYAKAALDHMLFQQLADYLSPGYLGRMESRAAGSYNERFWWKPGTGPAGARAPDLGRAAGQ